MFVEEKKAYFSEEDLREIQGREIPKHIAIVMDGNRRWARENNLFEGLGHAKGADNLIDIVKAAIDLNVKVLTVYTFSTENWNRKDEEVDDLLNLLKLNLISQRQEMRDNGVKLETIGDLSAFSEELLSVIDETKKATEDQNKITLVIAINYGSRNEITRAIKKMTQDCLDQKLLTSDINESTFGQYLDTSSFRDPDLLIRTSGEFRLSNFLLWQISYSEIYITNTLWPDFKPEHLLEAVKCYQKREIRKGA
jgi:undecaprenyl diphosphate synthase